MQTVLDEFDIPGGLLLFLFSLALSGFGFDLVGLLDRFSALGVFFFFTCLTILLAQVLSLINTLYTQTYTIGLLFLL